MSLERNSPTIAVVNAKGGSGKTTTAIHLSVALARRGYDVMVVDADMQHPLTRNFGVDPKGKCTIRDVLLGGIQLRDAAVRVRENLRIVPASLAMADIEVGLAMERGGDVRLRNAMTERNWEICIIDCPPNLGKVTYNALTAADYMLVPIDSALWAFEGLDMLMDAADSARCYHNPQLRLLGAVLTRANSTNIARSIREAVRRRWPRETMRTAIRNSVKYQEAVVQGETIFDQTNKDLHADYLGLTDEILERLGMVRHAVS